MTAEKNKYSYQDCWKYALSLRENIVIETDEEKLKVLDIGTGCGNIVISLAKNKPHWSLIGEFKTAIGTGTTQIEANKNCKIKILEAKDISVKHDTAVSNIKADVEDDKDATKKQTNLDVEGTYKRGYFFNSIEITKIGGQELKNKLNLSTKADFLGMNW
ncbi:11519_t:CDS:2 [Ambispora leptoticha]|uniref:11519_t:CDS:1 n=1 Tax=Ambispora leptoticha TaxID=144679 RepID=A0A9N8YQH9_9GLOM|nr:11519_t:CDS:2 [Ambispora leptoticha]